MTKTNESFRVNETPEKLVFRKAQVTVVITLLFNAI